MVPPTNQMPMNLISGQGLRVPTVLLATGALILAAFPGGLRQAASQAPGGALKAGATLTYGSGDREQPPWTIDSVHRDVALGGRTGCARIFLRMRPDQTNAPPRVACRGGDTLFSWNVASSVWRAERPLGAGMTLRVPQPSGASLDYTTAQLGDTTISGHRVGFVQTTIITNDPTGRPVRRLRERYAISLATALGGIFEVPDSTNAGVWKESQKFDLLRLSIP